MLCYVMFVLHTVNTIRPFCTLVTPQLWSRESNTLSDEARCLKVSGYTKNRTYRRLSRAPYVQFLGIRGPSLTLKKKFEFGIGGVLRGLLAFFSLFLVDILSRSQFLPTHPISMQIWTNYETHIFTKWSGVIRCTAVAGLILWRPLLPYGYS